jgi:hypothetical protein
MPAGYSGTPLPTKLGIRPDTRVVALKAPWPYASVVGPLPPGATVTTRLPTRAAFIHLFVRDVATLQQQLPRAERALQDSGALWVSWPKQRSGVPTDVTETEVRAAALAARLVDVKVCAVDDTWSGLKLVRRLRDRGAG